MEGTIKFWDAAKGYGLIEREDGGPDVPSGDDGAELAAAQHALLLGRHKRDTATRNAHKHWDFVAVMAES